MIAAVILSVALVAGIVTVFAEYIKSSRAKRVIATYGDEGALFSSNYLVMNTNTAVNVYRRIIYTDNGDLPVSGDVTVCNYAQGNLARLYENDIEYVLSAKLVKLSESSGLYVKTDAAAADVGSHTVKLKFKGGAVVTLSSSNLSHTFSDSTLDHRVTSTDVCSVEFDAGFKDAPTLCLYLCAEPTSAQAGVHTLDAVFNVAVNQGGEARNTWEGEFNEDTSSGVPAQPDYDGFNYVVSGTGSGSVTLEWNNTKLRISQVFLEEQGLTPAVSGTTSSVTFAVDSDVQNRYDLQFYYADGTTGFASWSELTGDSGGNGYVRLLFTE